MVTFLLFRLPSQRRVQDFGLGAGEVIFEVMSVGVLIKD